MLEIDRYFSVTDILADNELKYVYKNMKNKINWYDDLYVFYHINETPSRLNFDMVMYKPFILNSNEMNELSSELHKYKSFFFKEKELGNVKIKKFNLTYDNVIMAILCLKKK